jgi:hypothetical protein
MGRREERAAKAAAQRQADAGRAGLLLTIGVVGAAVTIAVAVLSGGRIPVPGLGILGAISGWLLARGIRGLRARPAPEPVQIDPARMVSRGPSAPSQLRHARHPPHPAVARRARKDNAVHSNPRRLIAAALGAALLLSGCGLPEPSVAGDPGRAKVALDPAAAAGNGIESKTPGTIVKTALAALRKARSVRMKGDFEEDGEAVGLDLKLTGKGDIAGWVESEGVRMHVIKSGERQFLRGREFLKQSAGPEIAELIGDDWMEVPLESDGSNDVTEGLDLKSLADELITEDDGFRKVGPAKVNGRAALKLKGPGQVLFVATTGKPYPLRWEATLEGQKIDFTGYDKNQGIKAPADAVGPDDLQERAETYGRPSA